MRGPLIDTSVWIYHFEQNSTFGEAAGYVIEQLEAGKFRGIASELTLLELIVSKHSGNPVLSAVI